MKTAMIQVVAAGERELVIAAAAEGPEIGTAVMA